MSRPKFQEFKEQAAWYVKFLLIMFIVMPIVGAVLLFATEWMEDNWRLTKDIFWGLVFFVVMGFVFALAFFGKGGGGGTGPGSSGGLDS